MRNSSKDIDFLANIFIHIHVPYYHKLKLQMCDNQACKVFLVGTGSQTGQIKAGKIFNWSDEYPSSIRYKKCILNGQEYLKTGKILRKCLQSIRSQSRQINSKDEFIRKFRKNSLIYEMNTKKAVD